MPNRILITGGAGFIGSQVSLKLISVGHQVRVLDNLSPQIHGENPSRSSLFRSIEGKVDFRLADVTSRPAMESALEEVDAVVHLAAETGTGQSMYAISRYSDVNVGGTALLLDLLANTKHRVKRVVVASSRAIYGEGKYHCPTHGSVYPGTRAATAMEAGDFEVHCPRCQAVCSALPTDEESTLSPASVYGVTKLTQEQLVLTVCRSLGISACAFRYQNVYGPGQSLSNPYTGILSIFSTRMLNGNGINVFEDGQESRDFVYIDDVVDATLLGVEKDFTGTLAMNIGSGTATSVFELATQLKSALGSPVPLQITGRFRVGDIRHNVADISRAARVLGYAPQVSFGRGLEKFASWVKNQAVEPDNYDASIEEMKAKGLYK